ncbi:MAG: DUF6428 family protein [Pseudomonadota bacterium]
MKISEVKDALSKLESVTFKLPDGSELPPHFHVTEVGLVTKHFIDCGGTERKETVANFQLWEEQDYDHRIAPEKFLKILNVCEKILGDEDYEIEVEYQQSTIGKFNLSFDGQAFQLENKYTACLALDACGIPPRTENSESQSCGSSGCC